MADYQDRIRKLAALLFVVSVFLVFTAIHVPSALPVQRTPIYGLLLAALATAVVVYRFPWRRYHPNWFLVVGVLATAMIALLIALSGRRDSIFFPLFVFVIVASGAYFTAIPLALITLVTSLGSFAYAFMGPVTGDDLLRSGFEVAIYVVAAFLCNAIFRGLERSSEAAHRHAATLDMLHRLDLLILARTDAGAFASAALRALGEVVPFERGAVGCLGAGGEDLEWIATKPADGRPELPCPAGPALRRLLAATCRAPLSGPGGAPDDPFPGVQGSWLALGLSFAGQPLGLLVLVRAAPTTWSAQEREQAALVADQLAIGLEQGRLIEEAARSEAERALLRMKEDFITEVSHELRNPLTTIISGSEMLSRGLKSPERAAQVAAGVHRASLHLRQMVDDLLDLARAERAGWTLERTRVNLIELAREAVEALVPPDGQSAGTVQLPEGEVWVEADRRRLKQVLLNLIGNALKYSPRGGRVRVECEEAAGEVVVRVRDEGVGIAPEAQLRLFERFYRAPNRLTADIPGTGLGLAIARELVEAHGGRIWASSEGVGHGSTFVVALPRAAAPLPAAPAADR